MAESAKHLKEQLKYFRVQMSMMVGRDSRYEIEPCFDALEESVLGYVAELEDRVVELERELESLD